VFLLRTEGQGRGISKGGGTSKKQRAHCTFDSYGKLKRGGQYELRGLLSRHSGSRLTIPDPGGGGREKLREGEGVKGTHGNVGGEFPFCRI